MSAARTCAAAHHPVVLPFDSFTHPGFSYGRINTPASETDCPTFQYAQLTTKWTKRNRTAALKAGSTFSYTLKLEDSRNVSQVLATNNSELVFMLPDYMSVRSIMAKPRSVTLTPITVSSGDPVWLVQAPAGGGAPITSVTVRAQIAVSPCAPSGSATIRAAFFPLGESAPSCNVGYDRPLQSTIRANRLKCKRAQKKQS